MTCQEEQDFWFHFNGSDLFEVIYVFNWQGKRRIASKEYSLMIPKIQYGYPSYFQNDSL